MHAGKESEHILRGKAYATVGGRGAQQADLVGAVYVDVAGAGVGVVGFQSVQGNDAGQDSVLPPSGGGVSSHRQAAAEHSHERGILPVQAANLRAPERRTPRAGLRAHTGLACGAIEAELP